MKTTTLLVLIMLLCIVNVFGQKLSVDLTFTAVNNAAHIQLDSIKVMNRTQGGETVINWHDTTLSLEINQGDLLLCVGYATFYLVGVSEVINESSSFELKQNYPNPMVDPSEISIYIPHTGKVHVMITDLQGRAVLRTARQLDGGHHSFRFYPGGGNFYFLTAQWNGISRSIKMISTGQQDGKSCRLDYIGGNTSEGVLKASSEVNDFIVRESGILDSPEESQTYTFQFATNIPCPGTPTVEYEGQVYNTIQISSQCWLKENLNVGIMIPWSQNQSDNGILEKDCYNNEPDSCTKYGGLYQWNEMIQYTTQQVARGICPSGWHLPTDEEWKVLEGAVASQYGIGDPEWEDAYDLRGDDAGTNLKTTNGWYGNGNGTDLFDFSGLPGGYRYYNGDFEDIVGYGYWWSSTERSYDHAWSRRLNYGYAGVRRHGNFKGHGFSVRCLRDY